MKHSVYERYSGIASLGLLASIYDIMTQMRHCGLREQLGLPSVYYELAVRDAITDIKGMWGMLKNKIRTLVSANENLSDEDRLYLRTVLRLDPVYAAILNRVEYPMPEKAAGLAIDTERLISCGDLPEDIWLSLRRRAGRTASAYRREAIPTGTVRSASYQECPEREYGFL